MDALIVATGLGLLAWTFLVVGFARQTGMPLAQAGAELARRTGTRCTVDAAPGLRLDSNRETVLYRVAQEALTNVTKRAQARTVEITVAVDGGTLDIQARPGHGTALVAHLPLSPSAPPPKALDLGGRWGSGLPPHG
jgi:hypothetical protein